MSTPSPWRSVLARRLAASVPVLLAALIAPPAAAQQDAMDAECASLGTAPAMAECRLAAGAARVIQPRMAAALFGGNPVPGTASTLGMRLGSLPRMSLALHVTGAPTELPPVLERGPSEGDRALLVGLTAEGTVGLLSGFSPLPTVGGVLSMDLVGRLGYLPLRGANGFSEGALGWAVGARVGLFRESFTLPGVSLTGTYGRITSVAFGEPGGGTDTYFEGAISDLRAGLAATKRLGLVGVTGAVAYDRYSSDLDVAFRHPGTGVPFPVAGEAVHERWSGYVNASWTLLIFHASAELGWQESPVPDGLPPDVSIDPVGWYGGLAFRVSI